MEFLLFTLVTGLAATIIFFSYLLTIHTPKTKKPPRASGAWPIIGHFPLLIGSNIPHKALADLADKYGPIFTIKLGIHEAIVVSSCKVAKELYTTNDVAFSNRPKLTALKLLGYNHATFTFAPYGDYWREMRRIVTGELLSNRKLELLKYVSGLEVRSSLKELYESWLQKQNRFFFLLVNLTDLFGDIAHNMVLRMVVGKRYGVDEKESTRVREAIREMFRLLGAFVLRDAVPYLGWIDFGGQEKAMKKTANEMDCIVSEWINEHRSKRANTEDQDFVDAMLSALEKTEFKEFDSDSVLKSTILMIFAAASDAILVVLVWTVSLLMNNQHVYRKVQEELDKNVGKERVVNESDVTNLVYLQSIVKESLRLHPPSPLPGPRMITEDCTIGGYHVKKGTRIIINSWKIQRDPNSWPDPSEFKPERFLTSHKNVDVRGQNYELIPFGSGRRGCPGISFGLQVVHFVLASFLQAFEITMPSNVVVDMTEIPGLTNMMASKLKVLVRPRLPSKLYT